MKSKEVLPCGCEIIRDCDLTGCGPVLEYAAVCAEHPEREKGCEYCGEIEFNPDCPQCQGIDR